MAGGTRQNPVRRKEVRADTRTWEQRQSGTKVNNKANLKIQDDPSLLLTLGPRKLPTMEGIDG